MTAAEIKEAIDKGLTVHWINPNYQVVKTQNDYMIKCLSNGHCVGLTWADNVTLNGKQEDFYTA